ncbi:MAG: UbiA family prenyltransferase, partial [Chloroflexota bacterium]
MSSISSESARGTVAYTWRDKLYGYLSLARVSNSPTVVSNAVAGAALAGIVTFNVDVVWIALSMVLFYTAGMYLNDILDYEIDMQERAERPLTTGLISMRAAVIVTGVLFAVALALLLLVNWRAFIGGIFLTGTIVLYDAWHKKNPLSPVIMGANRALVYLTAFVAFTASFTGGMLWAAGLLWVYIIALTFVAKSETQTSFSRYWPVALVLAPAAYFAVQLISTPAWLLLVAVFIGWTLYSTTFIYQKKQIGGGVVRLIAGISLFDAMALAATGWIGGVVIALA